MNDYLLYCSLLIGIVSLFVACFAITGYISFRDQSIPPGAEKTKSNIINLVEGQKEYSFTINLDKDEIIENIHLHYNMSSDNYFENINIDGSDISGVKPNTSSNEKVQSFKVTNQSKSNSRKTIKATLHKNYVNTSSNKKDLDVTTSRETVTATTRMHILNKDRKN